jgi:hypothetical protein
LDPFIFWALIACVVLALIIYAMVSAKLRTRKANKLRREAMPVVPSSLRAGVIYTVFLSNGSVFRDVKISGLTEAPLGPYADFPLESWLVLERLDGKRVFVKPRTVRYFEEL